MRRETATHIGALLAGVAATVYLYESAKPDISRNSNGGVTRVDRGNYSLVLGNEQQPNSLIVEIPQAQDLSTADTTRINKQLGGELLEMGCSVTEEKPLDNISVTIGGETVLTERREIVLADRNCFNRAK